MNPNILSPSSSTRKSVMWNIVEPGDPYDIKKSMIAVMPDDERKFMGDHLQMVCLLQAAQIERISQYLDQYKLRYRQLQRRQLDRHSYEVQIKQLTMRLASFGNLKTENSKLKDFIVKQSSQIQDLKREIQQYSHGSTIQNKYHTCLLQLQTITREFNITREQKRMMSIEIEQYIAKISAIEAAKNRQLQQLRIQLSDNSKFAFESDKRQLILKFQSEISRLEYENRRYRQNLEAKNLEIEQLNLRILKIEKMHKSPSHDEQLLRQQMKRKVSEYQNRFAIMSQQIERLNIIIKNKSNQVNEISLKLRDLQYELQRKDSQIKQYEFRIVNFEKEINILNISIRDYKIQSENSRNNIYYEQRIKSLNDEIGRINIIVVQKVDQITVLSRRVQQYEYEIKSIELIRRENQEYKRQFNDYTELRRRIGQYENKMSSFKLQIERLTSILSSKDHQISTYDGRNRSLQQELEKYKKRIEEFELTISSEMKTRIQTYEQRIYTFTQQIAQYENKIALMRQEIERLNQIARVKSQQAVNYQNHIKNLKIEIQSYRNRIHEVQGSLSMDMQNKVASFEQKIYKFNQENEELRRKVNYLNQANIKLSQDLQRYQTNNRALQQQLQARSRKHSEFQTSISRQWQIKMTMYQQKLYNFGQQNQELGRRLFQMTQINKRLPQYENKIALLSQQIQRLTLGIRQRQRQLQSWHRKYTQLENSTGHQIHTKFSSYQQRIVVITKEVQEYRRRISQYESRMSISNQQIQRLSQTLNLLENRNRSLQQELQHSRRKFGDTEREIVHEWQTKISTYESRIVSFTQQNQQLVRRLQQTEGKLGMARQEIDRLNQIIRAKSQQFGGSQVRIRNLQQQLQVLRQRFTQNQSSMSHDFNSKITVFQQRITIISQQNEVLKRRLQDMGEIGRKVVDYQAKIAILSQQIQRTNQVIRVRNEQFGSLEHRYRQTVQQLQITRRRNNQLELSGSNVSRQWQMQISNFQQRITVFTRENDDLKRRISQLENRIQILTQENQKLNQVLRIKTDQFNNLNRNHQQEIQNIRRRISQTEVSINQEWNTKVVFFEQKIQAFSRENIELERRLRQVLDANRSIPDYQNKLQGYLRQIERLNIQIQKFNKENSSLSQRVSQLDVLRQKLTNNENQYNRLQSEHNSILQQFNEFRSRFTLITKQNESLKQQIRYLSQDSGKKGASMAQQIQRMHIAIRNKTEQCNSMELAIRNLKNELQISRRRIVEIQTSMGSQWHSKVNVFEQKITVFSRQNDQLKRRLAEGQNKIVIQLQQIERLNQVIKIKIDEIKSAQVRFQQQTMVYKRRITEIESSMSQQWTTKTTFFQNNITNLNREKQQLKRRLNQTNERNNRTVSQYETKIAFFSQQIERLTVTLRNKSDESSGSVRNLQKQLQQMRRRIKQQQNSMYSEWQSKTSIYEQKISAMNNENIQHKRKIAEYQSKIALLSQETQRLNITLRNKSEQFAGLQATYNQLRIKFESYHEISVSNEGQHQRLKQGYFLICEQYEKSKLHIGEYETSIKRLHIQFERLQHYVNQIKQENTVLRKQLQEGNLWSEKNKILSGEINRLTQLTEQQKSELQQVRIRLCDDVALQKRINEHMALMVVLFAEIESLRKRVQDKERQCQEVRRSSLAPFKSL